MGERIRFKYDSVEQIVEASSTIAAGTSMLRDVIEAEWRDRKNERPDDFDWLENVLCAMEEINEDIREKFEQEMEAEEHE